MKIFKNKFLLGLIIGVLFFSAVGVYAAISIMASDIGYSNSKTSATNAKDALNTSYMDKVPTGEVILIVYCMVLIQFFQRFNSCYYKQ